MLKILQKRLAVALDDEEASQVQQSLQARYNSLLHRVRLEYLDRLGLDYDAYSLTGPPRDSALTVGEIFMPEPGSILYLKGNRGGRWLEAGAITRELGRDFTEFFQEVREAVVEVHGAAAEWEAMPGDAELRVEDARPGDAEVPEAHLQAAREMMDGHSRTLLERIQEAGSIFFNKIETEDRQDTENRIRRFEELDLVAKDFAVLCRRTGQQILRVADRATIEESSQKAFKCFICGNAISQEVVEEILTCTETCTELLGDQKWLQVVVEGILAGAGIGSENLQVYQATGAPVQLFLSLNGQRYLFVLTTSRLSLDQAYLVGAHLSAYDLDHAIVISSEKISTLMKHHLAQANPDTKFHFLDSLEGLDERLTRTLLEKQRAYLHALLGPLSGMTPVRVPELVLRKMAPELPVEAPEEDPEETGRRRPRNRVEAPEPEALPEEEFLVDEASLAEEMPEETGYEVAYERPYEEDLVES